MNLYSKNIFDKLSRNTRHTKYSTELVDITSGNYVNLKPNKEIRLGSRLIKTWPRNAKSIHESYYKLLISGNKEAIVLRIIVKRSFQNRPEIRQRI